jgi:hypothetical protein
LDNEKPSRSSATALDDAAAEREEREVPRSRHDGDERLAPMAQCRHAVAHPLLRVGHDAARDLDDPGEDRATVVVVDLGEVVGDRAHAAIIAG